MEEDPDSSFQLNFINQRYHRKSKPNSTTEALFNRKTNKKHDKPDLRLKLTIPSTRPALWLVLPLGSAPTGTTSACEAIFK